MAEFIGSRISLISKRDIRYVGTLHKIDSENSTVALEQVVSFGTEGRRPEDEVAPTDVVYDYIVFRGSDVKDLRIEETPKENQPPKPKVPDDPAILGSGRGLTSPTAERVSAPEEQQTQTQQAQQLQQTQQTPQAQPFHTQHLQSQQSLQNQQSYQYQQRQQQFPLYYPPPPNPRFGPQGFPHPSGFPGMPYGAPPPAWFPPGQGFHYPHPASGQFYPPQPPIGSNAQQHAQHRAQIPSASQAPPASQALPVSQGPPASQGPATTQAPAVSQIPAVSQVPAVSQAPAVSQVPQAPVAPQAPTVPQAPAAPQAPLAPQTPAVPPAPPAPWVPPTQKAPAAPLNAKEEQRPPQVETEPQPEPSVQHPSVQDAPEKLVATVRLPSKSTTPAPPQILPSFIAQSGPPLPTGSKPDIVAELAPPAISASAEPDSTMEVIPTGPRNGRIMPAIPRHSPAFKAHVQVSVPVSGALQPNVANVVNQNTQPAAKLNPGRPAQIATKSLDDANRDARAAVAAAMAKLPPAPGQKKQGERENAVDNLTNKVNELRANETFRASRQPGASQGTTYRGGRAGYRGGRSHPEQNVRKVEVPTTDYDFASANAKFNKQDLVKEVIASGPTIASPVDGASVDDKNIQASSNDSRHGSQSNIVIPSSASYDKSSSFFDNISSESKDRDDANGKKLGGREFRSEEVRKNFETFGQGSVDNGYRGGYRGRARGRGYGRGRGGYGRGGRGQIRGGAGAAAVIAEG